MELFVSTTASARATAPLSFAPLRRGASPSVVALLRRRLPARVLPCFGLFASGWRRAQAAVPDPVPAEEPSSASYAVFVTDKPTESSAGEKGGEETSASTADEKGREEASASTAASVEATAVSPVSSGPSEENSGLDVEDILSKLNIEVTPTLILTGSGAFLALWVLSSVVSAIDSIPLLPKLLELVGLGYSVWFTWRFLLFKESRDELFAKFEDLKQRVI